MTGFSLGMGFRAAHGAYGGVAYDYVINATTGSDTNNGLTEDTAWASLSKIEEVPLSAGETKRVLVKSATYNTADDRVLVSDAVASGGGGAGSTLEIVFESGCVMDGTAANAVSPTSGFEFSGANAWTAIVRGNGLQVNNYAEGTVDSPNGFGNRDSNILYVYDAHVFNCDDGFSCHGSAHMYTYDCSASGCEKGAYIHVDNCTVEHHRCEFVVKSTTNGIASGTVSLKLYNCVVTADTASGRGMGGGDYFNCQVGTYTGRLDNFGSTTFTDCFVNVYSDGTRNIALNRCFGRLSLRVRPGGTHVVNHCVLSEAATGQSSIILSNSNFSGAQTLAFSDNIIETSTAAKFMSVDATNAGYLVSAGAEFFNNVLSGSAAYDADFIAADTGGTVIVDTVTGDANIGPANTLAMADYAFVSPSIAENAATDGGDCGFGESEAVAVGVPA